MKITRTITKASYSVLVFNKNTKEMENKDFVDTDNIKPEFLEKSIVRSLAKHERLVDFEQSERHSFKLTLNLEWNDDKPIVTVESIEPIETMAYAE